MARLVVLINSPHHLAHAEAENWLRDEASTLATIDGVQRGTLSRLASPSERWTNHWSWLIELECEAPGGAQQAVQDRAWTDLLGDLRLLGMRPSVALVAESRELGG